jgi:hypothetical protein
MKVFSPVSKRIDFSLCFVLRTIFLTRDFWQYYANNAGPVISYRGRKLFAKKGTNTGGD